MKTQTTEEIVKEEVKGVRKAMKKSPAQGVARALRMMVVVSTIGIVVRKALEVGRYVKY